VPVVTVEPSSCIVAAVADERFALLHCPTAWAVSHWCRCVSSCGIPFSRSIPPSSQFSSLSLLPKPRYRPLCASSSFSTPPSSGTLYLIRSATSAAAGTRCRGAAELRRRPGGRPSGDVAVAAAASATAAAASTAAAATASTASNRPVALGGGRRAAAVGVPAPVAPVATHSTATHRCGRRCGAPPPRSPARPPGDIAWRPLGARRASPGRRRPPWRVVHCPAPSTGRAAVAAIGRRRVFVLVAQAPCRPRRCLPPAEG